MPSSRLKLFLAGLLLVGCGGCQKGPPAPDPQAVAALQAKNRAEEKAEFLRQVAAGQDSFELMTKAADNSWLEALKGKPIVALNLVSLPVTDEGIAHLAGNPKMKKLLLEGTKMSDAGMRVVADMPELTVLTMNGEITDEGLKPVAGLTNLVELMLSDKVTDKGLPQLSRLTNLDSLGPLGPGVSGAGIDALFPLQKLTTLRFYNSNITDADLDKLARFPELTSLELTGTKITDAGLMKLAKLPKLKVLIIGSTAVTPEGVAKLRAAKPDLTDVVL
ncbi:MAG: hypothetical protein U0836_06415 [Pirellulales bacterium]